MHPDTTARTTSFTCGFTGPLRPGGEDGTLVPVEPTAEVPRLLAPTLAAIHGALSAFVDHATYPCLGARAALHQGHYRVGVCETLGSRPAVEAATTDVQWFAQHADQIDEHFATFLGVFLGPAPADEARFEAALWRQLQGMHELDAAEFPWDPSVSANPGDPGFSFSLAKTGFFIVGMHPAASRVARRFPYAVLVWNLHAQFERLRAAGKFERMRTVIRERDTALHGRPNPELEDHGEASEARQYSGRRHGPNWRAPFTPTTARESSHD